MRSRIDSQTTISADPRSGQQSGPNIGVDTSMAQTLSRPQAPSALPLSNVPLRFPERKLILVLGDLFVLLAAGAIALAVWAIVRPETIQGRDLLIQQAPSLAKLVATFLVLWAAFGGYDLKAAVRPRTMHRRLLATLLVLSLFYMILYFLTSAPPYLLYPRFAGLGNARPLRLLPSLFMVFSMVGELAWRNVYPRVLAGDRFRRRALIIGTGRTGQIIAQTLYREGDGTYEITGFVDDDPDKLGAMIPLEPEPQNSRDIRPQAPSPQKPLYVLGNRHALRDLVAANNISTLILAATYEADGDLLPTLLDCLELGVEIVPMPVLYEQLTGRVPVEHVGDHWGVAMPIDHPGIGTIWPFIKRLMDIILAGMGLVCFGIALPFIALAIYLDSPGPIFYTQERTGKGGRIFRAYKLRSMIPNAENNGAVWAQKNDNRTTRVGRILRKTHVDEFPQFINILKGEMSAVGPRPERPEFVAELVQAIPFYRIRHAVKPGMAGWGLIKQGYGASKEDALLKLQYDLYYIKHQSLWLDLVILFRTIIDTLTFGGR